MKTLHLTMKNRSLVTIKILMVFLLVVNVTGFVFGLRIINATIPSIIERDKDVLLTCEHDTEGDTLYSLKWYKGMREFFRYTPKEIPSTKIFSTKGINIDVFGSNATHLVLKKVSPMTSGKFSCELSADAPSYQTIHYTREMEVVVRPPTNPVIQGVKLYYQVGEILHANCTLNESLPAAELEWKINNFVAFSSDIIKYPIRKDNRTKLEGRTIGISFPVSQQYFQQGKLMLQCIGRIYDIYYGEDTRVIEEEKIPQVFSPSLSYLSEDKQGKSGTIGTIVSNRTTSHIEILLYFLLLTVGLVTNL